MASTLAITVWAVVGLGFSSCIPELFTAMGGKTAERHPLPTHRIKRKPVFAGQINEYANAA